MGALVENIYFMVAINKQNNRREALSTRWFMNNKSIEDIHLSNTAKCHSKNTASIG